MLPTSLNHARWLLPHEKIQIVPEWLEKPKRHGLQERFGVFLKRIDGEPSEVVSVGAFVA